MSDVIHIGLSMAIFLVSLLIIAVLWVAVERCERDRDASRRQPPQPTRDLNARDERTARRG